MHELTVTFFCGLALGIVLGLLAMKLLIDWASED